MKKLFALTLVLSMILALCPINSFASSTSGTYGDLVWSFDSATGVLAVSGSGDMNDRESYQSAPWSAYEEEIVRVVIANGVTSIGNYAFWQLPKLSSVSIPQSVASIGDLAFAGCVSLTEVTIPDKVISIGIEAFDYCISLTDINIPDSVSSIGEDAFFCCESLQTITVDEDNLVYKSAGNCVIEKATGVLLFGCNNSIIPNDTSVTAIGDSAFSNCKKLTSVTIPDSVKTIGFHAFSFCESLETVIIGNGVLTIGMDAFCSCDNLTEVAFGNSVKEIGDYAFNYCESLKSIELPDSVTTIGGDAFYWCLSLTDLTIGKGVSEIGKGAFSRCDSLTNVVYNGTEEEWENIYIGDCNEPLMNAYDGSSSTHYNSYWEIFDDGTKQFVCADCGEVQKTLGADEFIPNDINGDNKFDMFDYVAVKNCVMKGADDEALLNRADVNGDGKINIFDYVAIKAAYFAQ